MTEETMTRDGEAEMLDLTVHKDTDHEAMEAMADRIAEAGILPVTVRRSNGISLVSVNDPRQLEDAMAIAAEFENERWGNALPELPGEDRDTSWLDHEAPYFHPGA